MNICADLRAFCKYCRHKKVTTFTPEELHVPAAARFKGKKILQPADLVKLFNIDTAVIGEKRIRDPLICAYRFQVLTGLRPGELMELEWPDIQGQTAQVQRAVNAHHEITHGKNQNAVRSFVLSDMACRVLMAQKAMDDEGPQMFGIGSQSSYYKAWKRYCDCNGLTGVFPYELRHTFVSAVKTPPAGEVKSVVGHSKDMDTFEVYGHTLDGEGETTAQDINAIFQKPTVAK